MTDINDRETYRREVRETPDGRVVHSETHRTQPFTDGVHRDLNNREVHHEVRETPDGHVVHSETHADRSVPDPNLAPRRPGYRDRFIQNRLTERRVVTDTSVRDNDNAARGLLIGIVLTSLAGLVIGTLFFLNQRDQVEAPDTPVLVVPNSSRPANQTPQVRDRVVPVPQQQAPAPNVNVTVPQQQAPAPNVNIAVPNPNRPAASTQTAPTSGVQSGTTTQPDSQSSAPANAGQTGLATEQTAPAGLVGSPSGQTPSGQTGATSGQAGTTSSQAGTTGTTSTTNNGTTNTTGGNANQ